MFGKRRLLTVNALILAVLSTQPLIVTSRAQAQAETVLYNFCSELNCSDGENSSATLVSDSSGNLYGTTVGGGSPGGGTVFELSPKGDGSWNETVLYNFCLAVVGCTDGSGPTNVILDRAGNLYGTTTDGGADGYGVVFELSQVGGTWTETVLHSFAAGADGAYPAAGVIMDAAGNLYGTNIEVIYELSPTNNGWTEQTLYNVGSYAPLTLDSVGNIFGVTVSPNNTAFELSPDDKGGWNLATLHTFCGVTTDGCSPRGPLVLDEAGNVYGVTASGGSKNLGTVYELSPVTKGKEKGTWTEKILYTFVGGKNADYPVAGIVFDAAGNIYGTTEHGGKDDGVYEGAGTVYELIAPKYTEKVLWSFDVTDGYQPVGRLILHSGGKLFGTTWVGGSSGGCPDGCGVVFEVTK
jgi:uncharacterized repeat protein (TIGR03803 family)